MCNLLECIQERVACSFFVGPEIKIINNKRARKKIFLIPSVSIDVLGVLVFDLA